MTKKYETIAAVLFEEHKSGKQSKELTGKNKLSSLDESYYVQLILNQMFQADGRGDYVGHKVALTSKPIQELCGLDHPIFGTMFSTDVFNSPRNLQLADFQHPGLEFELAVEIGETLPSDRSYDAASIRHYVSNIYPAFEVIEDRNADYSCLDVLTLAADNAWFGAAILGEPVKLADDFDIANTKTRLVVNGELFGEGITGAALGNPLNAAALLANHLNSRGETLSAGAKIITGSTLATQFPVTGDHYIYEITGVGSVEVTIR